MLCVISPLKVTCDANMRLLVVLFEALYSKRELSKDFSRFIFIVVFKCAEDTSGLTLVKVLVADCGRIEL